MAKRFVRKENIIYNASLLAGAQGSVNLYTTATARRETMVGIKGNITLTLDAPSTTGNAAISMVLAYVPNDQATPTISTTLNTAISDFLPNVVWSYHALLDEDNTNFINIPIDVKTMRKCKEGDRIAFYVRGDSSGTILYLVAGNFNTFLLES